MSCPCAQAVLMPQPLQLSETSLFKVRDVDPFCTHLAYHKNHALIVNIHGVVGDGIETFLAAMIDISLSSENAPLKDRTIMTSPMNLTSSLVRLSKDPILHMYTWHLDCDSMVKSSWCPSKLRYIPVTRSIGLDCTQSGQIHPLPGGYIPDQLVAHPDL